MYVLLDGETTTPILNKRINTGYALLFIAENRYAEAHSAATCYLVTTADYLQISESPK